MITTQLPHGPGDLERIYEARFKDNAAYRQAVWKVLSRYFSRWIPADSAVLDLGCGYCEFINAITCSVKYGMDLNPEAKRRAAADVIVLEQDCSQPWELPNGSLGSVFTSNFLEHLPDRPALERTLQHAYRALQPGGLLIAMGPNVKYVPGAYWDFFDHHVALTELSMREVLLKCGFDVIVCEGHFLPYSMSQGRTYPVWLLRAYLALRPMWSVFGKQFLVIGRKR